MTVGPALGHPKQRLTSSYASEAPVKVAGRPAQNGLSPLYSSGIIATPMFGADDDARAGKLAAITQGHAIPRAGTPGECAQAVLFLVTNSFVTGTTVDVDGGWLVG